jgi:hypothetical protein
LHCLSGDQPGERLCRIRAGDLGQRINRGRLLRHDPIGAETGKTAAQRFERGDRGGQVPPPRFGGESQVACKACIGQRSQQLLIPDAIRSDDRPRRLVRRRGVGRSRDVAEQIELMHRASRIGKIPDSR